MDGDDTKLFRGTFQRTNFVDKPTLETSDIGVRARKFTEYGFLWWSCNKLIRRDLIIDNAIEFPPVKVYEDMSFAFCLVVLAKKYVRVPNCFYCYRRRQDSLSHKPSDPFSVLNDLIRVMEALSNFMCHQEHFIQNPKDRYSVLDWHFQNKMHELCLILYDKMKLQPWHIEDLFRRDFFSELPKISPMIAAYFFTTTSFYRFKIYQMLGENNKLRENLTNERMQRIISAPKIPQATAEGALSLEQDNSLKLPPDFKLFGDGD